MRNQFILNNFISSSPYTAPVDKKKLRFIFSALEEYVNSNAIAFEKLYILEIACGNGGITLPLASLGCNVTAFDIDENAVKNLKTLINQKQLSNLNIIVDNGYTFDDGISYDIVIASEVFEHVLDPSRLANNIIKRMNKGSYLIVTIPNGFGPWELKNRLNLSAKLKKWNSLRLLFGKQLYIKGNGPDHCQFYTKNRILKMFSALNFGIIDFAKSDSFLCMFSKARRSSRIGELDIRLADIFPSWIASGWFFVFQSYGSKISANADTPINPDR
jgi:2-polyprenyl-3-methyl-5-hydroxy-6-metoxy-1,4-benzoquinol methylase